MKLQSVDSQFHHMVAAFNQVREVECIYIPWPMPLNNQVTQWGRMQRHQNVKFIHEAVRLSSEHMFDREDIPLEWEWLAEGCPKVDNRVTLKWFDERWQAQILAKRFQKGPNGRKIIPPLDHRECTVVELLRSPDDPRYWIHIHNIRVREHDEDGIATKWLVDGLRLVGFFPDDKKRYVASVTQSQAKPKGKEKLLLV